MDESTFIGVLVFLIVLLVLALGVTVFCWIRTCRYLRKSKGGSDAYSSRNSNEQTVEDTKGIGNYRNPQPVMDDPHITLSASGGGTPKGPRTNVVRVEANIDYPQIAGLQIQNVKGLPKGWKLVQGGQEMYVNAVTFRSSAQKPVISGASYQPKDGLPTYDDLDQLCTTIESNLFYKIIEEIENAQKSGSSISFTVPADESLSVEPNPVVVAACMISRIVCRAANDYYRSFGGVSLLDIDESQIRSIMDWKSHFRCDREIPLSGQDAQKVSMIISQGLLSEFIQSVYQLMITTICVTPPMEFPIYTIGQEIMFCQDVHSSVITTEEKTDDKCRIIFPGVAVKSDGKVAAPAIVSC